MDVTHSSGGDWLTGGLNSSYMVHIQHSFGKYYFSLFPLYIDQLLDLEQILKQKKFSSLIFLCTLPWLSSVFFSLPFFLSFL